jgi:hypothetical protein
MSTLIISPNEAPTNPAVLFDSTGNPISLNAPSAAPAPVSGPTLDPEIEAHNAKVMAQLAETVAKLQALKSTVAKNKVPGKARSGVKYVLLSKTLNAFGKVPQQQADIAKILSDNLEVGEPIGEAELFDLVSREGAMYPSIQKSVQNPTYLFKYYRGLKHEKNHAGFVARGFIRQVG